MINTVWNPVSCVTTVLDIFVCFAENFRQINERVNDRLYDVSTEYEQLPLNFHLTSVYDLSLHEAFSRVVHKLVESLAYLEHLLNVFIAVRSFFPVQAAAQTFIYGRISNVQKHTCTMSSRDYTLQQMLRLSMRRHIVSPVIFSSW